MRALALAALWALLAPIAAAHATDVGSGQLHALAVRGQTDPAALAELRAVDSVDGRPARIALALAGASGSVLQARLATLAAEGTAVGSGLADPGAEARNVLSSRRYTGTSIPRPFHGVLAWLGDRFAFVGRGFHALAAHIPGGESVLWAIIAGLVVAVALAAAWSIGRRRAGQLVEHEARQGVRDHENPDRLEGEAREAERRGDLEAALRLRFRAGLIRLAREGAIPRGSELTNAEVARRVGVLALHSLVGDFDRVAYGRQPADAGQVERARTDWPEVIAAARQR